MRVSSIGIEAIKNFEGLRLKAYKCSAGVPTIGYGHTKGVKMGQTITKEAADKFLRDDLRAVEMYVESKGLKLTQSQFDALCDFAFNLGNAALGKSTLLRYIKLGKPTKAIQAEFRKWVYAGGKVAQGLVKRRNWEAVMWEK